MIKKYVYNVGLGLDQFANAILLGDPDESLSGRLGRASFSGRPKWFVEPLRKANDWVWFALAGETNHSYRSVEPEETPKDKELWSWIKE